ncbi:hypothetical protein DXA13_08020 [Clostridium sp. AM58-1XD]|nr:hypothetical protein DXA13_08020 [Clostridium sp. AM58-1XD]
MVDPLIQNQMAEAVPFSVMETRPQSKIAITRAYIFLYRADQEATVHPFFGAKAQTGKVMAGRYGGLLFFWRYKTE